MTAYDARRIAHLRANGKKYSADLLNAESLDQVDSIIVYGVTEDEALRNAQEVFFGSYGPLHEWKGVGLTIQIKGPLV